MVEQYYYIYSHNITFFQCFSPDSFRVISEDATSDHPKYKPLTYRASFEPRTPTPKVAQQNNNSSAEQFEVNPIENIRPLKNTRVLPQILPDHRKHRPQPNSCGFLDRNVASLMEPICNVSKQPFTFYKLTFIIFTRRVSLYFVHGLWV